LKKDNNNKISIYGLEMIIPTEILLYIVSFSSLKEWSYLFFLSKTTNAAIKQVIERINPPFLFDKNAPINFSSKKNCFSCQKSYGIGFLNPGPIVISNKKKGLLEFRIVCCSKECVAKCSYYILNAAKFCEEWISYREKFLIPDRYESFIIEQHVDLRYSDQFPKMMRNYPHDGDLGSRLAIKNLRRLIVKDVFSICQKMLQK
jgi:hypothetical protein